MNIKNFIDQHKDKSVIHKKLADAVGVSESCVRAWAYGKRRPSISNLKALSEFTGLTKEQLRPDIYCIGSD